MELCAARQPLLEHPLAVGLYPRFPYMLVTQMHSPFLMSVGVTLLALCVFGYRRHSTLSFEQILDLFDA